MDTDAGYLAFGCCWPNDPCAAQLAGFQLRGFAAAPPLCDLLWQRATADLPHSLGVTIVYGHTPMPDMQVRWNLPYSIGIDTAAVYGGTLTALRLPDESVFQA